MKIWRFSLFFILSGILILTGCAGQSGDLEKVELAEVTRSIFYAPQYVALSEGFFEEEGLDVELTTTWGGDTTMTTLISDGADIALVGSETSIYVHQQGTGDPVINFAQLTQTDGTFLVAREEVDDFEWEDVKDKTYLGQRVGGMPQMVGEYVLKKNGIDPREDLDLIQNVDFGNIASSFASGTGDYVQLFEPEATVFEEEGIGHVVASLGEESGNIPYTSFMAKESYIADNEETVQKFTNALYRALDFVYEHSAEEVAASISPYFEDTDEEIIAQAVDRYKEQESYAPDLAMDEDGWYLLQEIIEEAGELNDTIDFEQLTDNRFAEEAVK